MKLSHLVRIVIIGFVASTAAGLIIITEYSIKEAFFPAKLTSLEHNLEHAQIRLELDLKKTEELLLSFAELPPISGIIRASQHDGFDSEENSSLDMWKSRLQKIWASHISQNHDLLQIRYLNAKTGYEVVRVNYDPDSPTRADIVPDDKLQNKGDRSYFKRSLGLKKGEVYISEFDLNQELGQVQFPFVPTARFVTPISDEKGELFGLIVINLNISRMLENFHYESPTQIVLWDSKGDFILHPNHLFEFGSDLGHPDLVESELPQVIPGFDQYERSGIVESPDFGKIFFSKRMLKIGPDYTLWSINFENYNQVYGSMIHVRNTAILLSLAFLIVTIGISVLLSYLITSPISKMISVLENTKHGEELKFSQCITREFCNIQSAIKEYHRKWVQSEKELHEAKGEILRTEAKAEAKSLFLANMSHEIRTPMNGVLGMTQILQSTELDCQQQECTNVIEGSANLLLTIIDDILDFSKIEAGKLAIEKIVMHPSELVEETLALLKPQADNKSLRMAMSVDPNVPERVVGDPMRIRQIITNLTSNAVKFTEVGKVEIHLSSNNLSPRESELIFKVMDTGVGIESSRLKSIFNAFTQADNSITRKYGGTGLGLTISHQLATMMNGTLEVESALDKGSTFTLVCPVKVMVDEELSHEGELAGAEKWHEGEIDFTKVRLLVAEDNQVNKLVAKAILSKMGFLFDIVPNGLEAIKALEIQQYDAILMDCQMPVMDGYTATRNIRSSGKPYANIPIIALTASALDTDIQKSIEAGMDAHVAKPIQINILQVKIARLLQDEIF